MNKSDIFKEKAKKVHGDKYDYTNVNYVKNNIKVCIICNEHGEFWQNPNNHLQGQGCPKCKGKNNSTESIIERFKKVHGNRYDYSKVEFKGVDKKVCILCSIHGEFWQTPYKHVQCHNGCPICRSSHLENEIRIFLIENNIKFIEQYRSKWLDKQSLDFYLTDYKIGIECQGEQHFLDDKTFGGYNIYSKILSRDKRKFEKCQENGIKLLYYSNLGIKYPYEVFEDKELLLNKIKSSKISSI